MASLDEWLYNGGPFQLSLPLPDWHLCQRVVSGNFPIAWVCVLSALHIAHPSLLLLLFLVILSVKVFLRCYASGISVLLTTCLYSKQNTISLCTRSICSVLLGYSGLFLHARKSGYLWFVKPQKQVPELLQVRSRRRLTSSPPMATSAFDLPIRFFQQLLPLHFFLVASCCWHLVHCTWCFHDGVQPERFQLQPVHHRWSRLCPTLATLSTALIQKLCMM